MYIWFSLSLHLAVTITHVYTVVTFVDLVQKPLILLSNLMLLFCVQVEEMDLGTIYVKTEEEEVKNVNVREVETPQSAVTRSYFFQHARARQDGEEWGSVSLPPILQCPNIHCHFACKDVTQSGKNWKIMLEHIKKSHRKGSDKLLREMKNHYIPTLTALNRKLLKCDN